LKRNKEITQLKVVCARLEEENKRCTKAINEFVENKEIDVNKLKDVKIYKYSYL
jgi:hypothetical protein